MDQDQATGQEIVDYPRYPHLIRAFGPFAFPVRVIAGFLLIVGIVFGGIKFVEWVNHHGQQNNSSMQSTQTGAVPQPPVLKTLDDSKCSAAAPFTDPFVCGLLLDPISHPRPVVSTRNAPTQTYDNQAHFSEFCTVPTGSVLIEIKPDGLGSVLAYYALSVKSAQVPNACVNNGIGFFDQDMFH